MVWRSGRGHRKTVGSAKQLAYVVDNGLQNSRLRPQYHFRKTPTGVDAWNVARLITLSESLPQFEIDPSAVAELQENHWYFHDGSIPSPASILEHVRLIGECDTSFPIILDSNGRLMDGMHRVCKALLEGREKLRAVQFVNDPDPDYRNCDPARLPYDDESRIPIG